MARLRPSPTKEGGKRKRESDSDNSAAKKVCRGGLLTICIGCGEYDRNNTLQNHICANNFDARKVQECIQVLNQTLRDHGFSTAAPPQPPPLPPPLPPVLPPILAKSKPKKQRTDTEIGLVNELKNFFTTKFGQTNEMTKATTEIPKAKRQNLDDILMQKRKELEDAKNVQPQGPSTSKGDPDNLRKALEKIRKSVGYSSEEDNGNADEEWE